MKSKTKPNDMIICYYENKETEKPIKIIQGCKDNKEEIKKLKIYYVKKFNNESKRIRIYEKKRTFPFENIKIIIKYDEPITNISRLFKGCINLKRVNFDYFDFSNINTKDVKGLFYNCDILEKPDLKKYENNNLKFDDIYGNEREEEEEENNSVPNFTLYNNNNEEDRNRTDRLVRSRMSTINPWIN